MDTSIIQYFENPYSLVLIGFLVIVLLFVLFWASNLKEVVPRGVKLNYQTPQEAIVLAGVYLSSDREEQADEVVSKAVSLWPDDSLIQSWLKYKSHAMAYVEMLKDNEKKIHEHELQLSISRLSPEEVKRVKLFVDTFFVSF